MPLGLREERMLHSIDGGPFRRSKVHTVESKATNDPITVPCEAAKGSLPDRATVLACFSQLGRGSEKRNVAKNFRTQNGIFFPREDTKKERHNH